MMDQLLNLFIPVAHAETTAPSPQGGGLSFTIMIVVFVLFMYFAIWRPQNKRSKEQQNLLNSIAKGDEVMTAGGLLGKITKVNGQYIGLTIAENVEITIQKSAVVNILPKGTLKSLN